MTVSIPFDKFNEISEVFQWVKHTSDELPGNEYLIVSSERFYVIHKRFIYRDSPGHYEVNIGYMSGTVPQDQIESQDPAPSPALLDTFPPVSRRTLVLHMQGTDPFNSTMIQYWVINP